MAESTRSGTCP